MIEECVVGVYRTATAAQQAVHVLDRAGFPTKQISLVAAAVDSRSPAVQELKLGDDSLRDAAIGAGLGGAIGLLGGLGYVTIFGLGLVFVAGPLALGLTGTTIGALVGSFVGWGVHKSQLQHYEECVKNGQSLVIATGDPLQLTHALRILQETDVVEVHPLAKTSSEAAGILDS